MRHWSGEKIPRVLRVLSFSPFGAGTRASNALPPSQSIEPRPADWRRNPSAQRLHQQRCSLSPHIIGAATLDASAGRTCPEGKCHTWTSQDKLVNESASVRHRIKLLFVTVVRSEAHREAGSIGGRGPSGLLWKPPLPRSRLSRADWRDGRDSPPLARTAAAGTRCENNKITMTNKS